MHKLAFAGTFAATLSEESYSAEFLRCKRGKERKQIQNNINDDSSYNEAITENEYKVALNRAKKSALVHDRITYSKLKYLHPAATKIIRELYNRIFSRV